MKQAGCRSVMIWVSIVFSPILSYGYGVMIVLFQAGLTTRNLMVAGVNVLQVMVFSIVLSYVLVRGLKTVLLEVPDRSDRVIVYGVLSVGLALFWGWSRMLENGMYDLLTMAGWVSVLLAALITVFWRISAHALVFAGVSTVVFYGSMPGLVLCAGLLVLIACSRVYLGKHTVLQVVVGSFLGVLIAVGCGFMVHPM
jgi:membrane-associated phospholipid phosphatase